MKRKILIGIVFIIILYILLIPNKVSAVANNEYIIQAYNIDMVVNEDNTFDITETIMAYFNEPKHGIFRKIPMKNSVIRTDGTKTSNRAKIKNISVDKNFTISTSSDYKTIKIGDADKVLTGNHIYTIKYTYDIGKDQLENADELYFNLIGNQWDTSISNVTFSIKMPKEFDKSLLGFSSGNVSSTDSSHVKYTVNGNVITGNLDNTLSIGQALTIRLTLPEGYFISTRYNIDIFSIFIIAICLACVLIADRIWVKYGKDRELVETVEFYPPEGYNSAELGFLYKGSVDTEATVSLLIYLASKGYLKIEEVKEEEQKGALNSSSISKDFKITQLKEYDGNNKCEEMFIEGLFKSKESKSAKKIMEGEQLQGKKITFEEALKLFKSGRERTVTGSELYNKFYSTISKIEKRISSKKDLIFETIATKRMKLMFLMIIAIFILISVKPVLELMGMRGDRVIVIIIPMIIGFMAIMRSIFQKYIPKIGAIIFGVSIGISIGGIPWVICILPILLENFSYLITYIIGIICIATISAFAILMPKRTEYGTEILGKIKGFKRFLETAEKPQLEALVEKNPEYFYDILPYTYALGVSETWMNQFETIALKAPDWYSGYSTFSVNDFNSFINTTMQSAQTVMIYAPSSGGSSSSGSSFSSGSSSGGGSSGGGSGGGGGGSW